MPVLPSFEIRNFRTFSHLRIERLGRVNLIVGKNNVGKTTLLEALRFYAVGSATALQETLVDHDEVARSGGVGEAELDLRTLFHGRQQRPNDIELGFSERKLRIRLIDITRIEESDGTFYYQELKDEGIIPEGDISKGVIIQRNSRQVLVSPEPTQRAIGRGRYVGPAYVPAGGVREADLVQWWDTIALTQAEERVAECLSLLAPVERITATEDPIQRGRRTFKVRVPGDSTPVPLRTLGGGPCRAFQLAVAIEYAHVASQKREVSLLDESGEELWQRNDLLLIDEIENGIHHTVQAEVWKFLFRVARLHDLQVFATSHSQDCIEGFQKALAVDEEADGLMVRLEKVEGEEQTGAVIIDREDLPIIVRDSIEVR